jgi:uncharacterized protein YeaO (DUF488 family)
MVVRTKSIFQPREEAEDGLRVLITRYYPRGVKKEHFDEWVKDLSPSRELLFKYNEGKLDWSEFEASFLSEIRNNNDSLNAIDALRKASRSIDITLLCYEKDGQPCHRYLVKDLIEKNPIAAADSGA